jgi:D-serine deaminase-like pyridoxal phosphate-dependent protein
MNRRTFFATTMSTGIVAATAAELTPAFAAETPLEDLTKAAIPTPALIVGLDALEANIAKMAEHCRQAKCSFRPHAKTHKCPEIARRQVAVGAIGICAATVPEAEALVAAGIRGVLLTSPIVDGGKIARMVALATSAGAGSVMLSVGHQREAALLAEAADAAKVEIDVLVDLDVGDKRTGALPGEKAVELARLISMSKRLTVRGVQAYAGHASHTVGFEARQ